MIRQIAMLAESNHSPNEYVSHHTSSSQFIAIYSHDTSHDAAKHKSPNAPDYDDVEFIPIIQHPGMTHMDLAKQVLDTGQKVFLASDLDNEAIGFLEENGVKVYRSVMMSLYDNYRAWADSTLFDLWEWQNKEPNPYRQIKR